MPYGNLGGASAATGPFSKRGDRRGKTQISRNLQARIASGLVLAPPVLAAALWGGPVFDLIIFAFTVAALREWLRMVWPEPPGIAVGFAYFGLFFVLISAWTGGAIIALLVTLILAGAMYWIARQMEAAHPYLIAFAVPYLGLSLVGFVWLRTGDAHGWRDLLFVLLTVWAADIGGFLFGKWLGGPKLWPRISPKKTWAGTIGGEALALAVALGWAVLLGANPLAAGLIGLLIAAVGQAGDLFESAMKRRYGLKDSGGLIPGHGGVLDRIDSLLWAVPFFALLTSITGRLVTWP